LPPQPTDPNQIARLPRPNPQGSPGVSKLASREHCLSLADVRDRDGDLKRNADALGDPGFCITVDKFKERRRPWTIQTVASGRAGPVWAVLHDDEDVAFDSAVHALKTYGGTLVAIETGGKRNQDGIDPNRNFSDDQLSCEKLDKAAAPVFTTALKKHFDPGYPIIALHSNVDGPVPTGGLGHVSMKAPPKGYKVTPSKVQDSKLAGDRNLVLLAATDLDDTGLKSTVANLSGRGVNVIVEPVRGKTGDCSLSNYSVLTEHKKYFNVTVDQDGGETQREIIDAIMSGFTTVSALR
jgi:hypothetical protein